ncbi:MAG TPA: hypothetical protein VL172_21645, partial [Kofleriaceae bacterium]|nr:hypothetical protein [Kofleriaceae bacterium]
MAGPAWAQPGAGPAWAQPAAGPAWAQPAAVVDVRVVDVSDGRAYLEPGEDAGLRVGQVVSLRGQTVAIAAVSRGHVVVEATPMALAIGDRGTVAVGAGAPAAPVVERMAAPRPLAAYREQWPPAVPPGRAPAARRVPLGRTAAARWRLTAETTGLAIAGDASVTALSARVRVSAEPWCAPIFGPPVGIDADAAALLWLGAAGGDDRARPPVRVRELRLRWGAEADPLAAAGRLRWAGVALGPLDGVRVSAPAG